MNCSGVVLMAVVVVAVGGMRVAVGGRMLNVRAVRLMNAADGTALLMRG